MKDTCRARRRKDSNGRKWYKSKSEKKSENGHEVKQCSLSKSDVEWQPQMCLQDSGRKKGDVSLYVSLPR